MRSIESRSTRKTERTAAGAAWSDSPWGLSDQAGCAVGGWSWPAFARRPGLLSEAPLSGRQALLILTVVLLVSLCAVLACQDIPAAPNSSGNDLLADVSSSKLNSTSAEAPRSRQAPALPSEPDLKHSGKKEPPAFRLWSPV